MIKALLFSFFISISMFTFGNSRDGFFVSQNDSINSINSIDTVRYSSDYIYFTKVVDMKIYDMKGSLVVERRVDQFDVNFLNPGVYILVYDNQRTLYLKYD